MSDPRYPESLGFKSGTSGTHTSRTIMLAELTLLLAAVGAGAAREDFIRAVVDDNVLGKSTTSTRRISAQRLTELYALDTTVPIFRVLQRLWSVDRDAQPLLALEIAPPFDAIYFARRSEFLDGFLSATDFSDFSSS